MLKYLDSSIMQTFSAGSILLGSGGAGNALILCPLLENYLSHNKLKVELIPYHQIPDDFNVAAVGLLGSPELMEENLPDGTEGARAIRLLERSMNLKIDALYALEGAGVNNLYPLLVAAYCGLPLIDGDGMGRAFPDLQMTTFHIYGQSGTPFSLVTPDGKEYNFYDGDNFMLEINARKALMNYGGVGYFAGFAMSGRKVKEYMVPGTISFAVDLGSALQKGSYEDAFADLVSCTKNSIYGRAIELFIGTVAEIGNIDRLMLNSVLLNGIKNYNNDTFNVLFQNENVFAYRNNMVVAMVPDIISFLEYPSGKPLNNNEIHTGMDVAVIGIPSPNLLRTKRALSVVGPHSFGNKMEYIPLEKIHYNYYFG
ncbi:MAG: DUF917 domain-containing protein [Desulfotomaculum sp.]|nr:DUF917 domain-containing protein [Desulfotomaculum sp.]